MREIKVGDAYIKRDEGSLNIVGVVVKADPASKYVTGTELWSFAGTLSSVNVNIVRDKSVIELFPETGVLFPEGQSMIEEIIETTARVMVSPVERDPCEQTEF